MNSLALLNTTTKFISDAGFYSFPPHHSSTNSPYRADFLQVFTVSLVILSNLCEKEDLLPLQLRFFRQTQKIQTFKNM
jgi:hypothetical protein